MHDQSISSLDSTTDVLSDFIWVKMFLNVISRRQKSPLARLALKDGVLKDASLRRIVFYEVNGYPVAILI